MKTMVLVLAVLAGATEARAQGGNVYFDRNVTIVLGGLETSIVLAGLATGIGSTVSLVKGTRSGRWFVFSAITGTVHLVIGLGVMVLAGSPGVRDFRDVINPIYATVASAHLAMALWNLIACTAGFLSPEPPAEKGLSVSPAFFGGRGWSGVGVRVTGF